MYILPGSFSQGKIRDKVAHRVYGNREYIIFLYYERKRKEHAYLLKKYRTFFRFLKFLKIYNFEILKMKYQRLLQNLKEISIFCYTKVQLMFVTKNLHNKRTCENLDKKEHVQERVEEV